MATRPYTIIPLDPKAANAGVFMVRWDGLLNGDDGDPLDLAAYADRTIQLFGVPGVGGNLRGQGSLMPNPTSVDWGTATDPQGNDINLTIPTKFESVSEATRWFRPLVTAGDGSTSFTLIFLGIRR